MLTHHMREAGDSWWSQWGQSTGALLVVGVTEQEETALCRLNIFLGPISRTSSGLSAVSLSQSFFFCNEIFIWTFSISLVILSMELTNIKGYFIQSK